MQKEFRAKICWVSYENGGRLKPPPGPKYSTVACFKDIKYKWPKEAWSVVLEINIPPDINLCHEVKIDFLFEDAPKNLFYPGSKFELFEGRKKVATGEIL